MLKQILRRLVGAMLFASAVVLIWYWLVIEAGAPATPDVETGHVWRVFYTGKGERFIRLHEYLVFMSPVILGVPVGLLALWRAWQRHAQSGRPKV